MNAKTVSTKSLNLYAEEVEVDAWFPQTIDEYFSSLINDEGNVPPLVIHLFREILVDVNSVPDYFPPPMEEGDTVENDWIPANTYFVAGVHDYGYWVLRGDESGYDPIKTLSPGDWESPTVKTISFRPCGIASRTSEIDREV